MDEYLDPFFSSSSWSDVNIKERSSWVCSEPGEETNSLLPDSIEILNSCRTMDNSTAQGTRSIVLNGMSDLVPENGSLSAHVRPQDDDQSYKGNPSVHEELSGSAKAKYVDLQLDTAISTPGMLMISSPKQLPVGGMVKSPLIVNESSHVGSNGRESSEYERSLKNSQTLPPIQQMWPPPSYDGVSLLSPAMGQDKMRGFGMQGEYVDNGLDVMESSYIDNGDSCMSVSLKVNRELQNCPLLAFAAGPQITMTAAGLQPPPQIASATACGGCNGTGNPRTRARRGQATDPHSIAERLRREKISERMKNLQEFVPNSSKTDKASMLDEIIEYVKFLQLQVKVLSMSRRGAAMAVVPLLTDGQAEGSNGLLQSQADISECPDQIAFEQKVLNLMESNMTTAMQYLQSKGLCLMPVALASAMSSGKAPSSGSFCDQKKKFNLADSLAPKSQWHQQ